MSLDQKIIWNELRVPDLDAAEAFYGSLFGWRTDPKERATYVHFYMGQDTVGGYMGPHEGPGDPPHWHVYVGCSDVDAYVERAKDAGGRALMPAMDIAHTGRVCSIADPGGAVLSPFDVAEPERQSWGLRGKDGHFCWTELLTQDAQRAKDFYTQVVGWKLLEADMDGTPYCMLVPTGGQPDDAQGGIMQMKDPEVADGWLPYVGVGSVDETVAKAQELGAKLCVPPFDLGVHGRAAVIVDPQGAILGIYES